MFRKKTVLVLGAGASVEFKMPAGDGLAKNIVERTGFWLGEGNAWQRGDQFLYNALKDQNPNNNEVLLAGRRISEGLGLSRSIDDFLYNHGHDKLMVAVGKAAIVRSILEAEARSTLMEFESDEASVRQDALSTHAGSWLQRFFGFIQTGVRLDEVDEIFDGLSIINFNYDRCVETYLFHALQRGYSLPPDRAAQIMTTLDITHPYGQVGRLRWQDPGRAGVSFGERVRDERIISLSEQIKTFTEQAHDEEEKGHWRQVLAEADQVVFLGFGFHKQNVELLSRERPLGHPPDVYATAYDTSSTDQNVFGRRICWIFGQDEPGNYQLQIEISIEIRDLTCIEAMVEWGLELSS